MLMNVDVMKTKYSLFIEFITSNITDAAPDITQFNNTRRGADRVTRYVNLSQTDSGDTGI